MSKLDVEQAKELYETGKSLSEVSKELGVSRASISYAFKRHGIQTRKPPTFKTGITQAEVKRLVLGGMTMAQIALREGVSANTISKILTKGRKKAPNSGGNVKYYVLIGPCKMGSAH